MSEDFHPISECETRGCAYITEAPLEVLDDEEFCPDCFAGIESSEHHETCIRPYD